MSTLLVFDEHHHHQQQNVVVASTTATTTSGAEWKTEPPPPSSYPNAIVSITRPSDIPKLATWLRQVRQQQQQQQQKQNQEQEDTRFLYMEELILRGIEIDIGVTSLLIELTNLNTNPNGWHSMEILNCEGGITTSSSLSTMQAAATAARTTTTTTTTTTTSAATATTGSGGGVHVAICHAIRTNKVQHLSLVNVEIDHTGYVELGHAISSFTSKSLQSLRLTTPLLLQEDVHVLITNGIGKSKTSMFRVLDFKGTTFDTTTTYATTTTATTASSSNAIYELAKGLRNIKSLEELKLYGCSLDDTDLSIITKALVYHPTLRVLDYNGNYCGKQTSYKLAEVLSTSQCQLVKLDLSCQRTTTTISSSTSTPDETDGNCIDITTLSKALQTNASLQILDLSSNRNIISTSSQLHSLGRALATNSTLKELYLSRNRISSNNMELLAQTYFPIMYGLQRLSLWGNELTERNVEMLHTALMHGENTTLEQLDLFQKFKCSEQIQHLLCLNRGGRRIYYHHRNKLRHRNQQERTGEGEGDEEEDQHGIIDPNTIPAGLWPHVMARINRIKMVKSSTANATSSFLSSYNCNNNSNSNSAVVSSSGNKYNNIIGGVVTSNKKDQKARLNALYYFVRTSPAVLCGRSSSSS